MVYLAELLVVMTDGLKIVRIQAQNVYHVHGRRRLDDDASLASLSLKVSDSVVFSMRLGRRPIETQKTRPRTTCACVVVASKQESCRDSMPSSL